LVRERSKMLGGDGLVPTRTWQEPGDLDSERARRERPETNDPEAKDLRWKLANQDRDVAARLSAMVKPAETGLELDLTGALRQAQRTGREVLNAEEEYILAAIRLLIQRHLWSPRFFGSISPQIVSRYAPTQQNTTALEVVNQLGVTQRLPYGGEVEAAYVYSLTEQLRESATDRYVDSSSLVLSATLPLLRGAGDVAREDLIQSERSLVYAARAFEDFRRSYLVSIARDYFDLLQQQREIANQENALKQLRALETRTAALVEAGRLAEFQKNIASNDVLVATSRLASQAERYVLALDRFKVRLGLDVNASVVIKSEGLELPEPEITPEAAGEVALLYRLDLQTLRDRVEDQRRAVRNSKNALLADLNVVGSANLGGDQLSQRGQPFVNPDRSTISAGLTLNLPLDRETERLQLRSATIAFEQQQRTLEQTRDNVIVEARSRVRAIERTRFALQLAERAVFINKRRMEEQELKADTVTAQDAVDTANALRDAENSRDGAMTDLKNAVLDYLLSTGKLRVTRDGQLQKPVAE
jgi:outer membrane protein TolC